MENLKNLITLYRNDIHNASVIMLIISIVSFFITFFIKIGENNKLTSELTPDKFNTVRKNIDNTRITMFVFLGLIIFFGLIWFIINYLLI
jgi:hypothetical protein